MPPVEFFETAVPASNSGSQTRYEFAQKSFLLNASFDAASVAAVGVTSASEVGEGLISGAASVGDGTGSAVGVVSFF